MKKVILLLTVLLILCSCKEVNNNDLKSLLDNTFDNINDINEYHINNNMAYFSYYLPSDMSEEELDSDSIVLKYNNSKIIMNLNIVNIINTKYYNDHILEDEKLFDDKYLIYNKQGSFKNYKDEDKRYICHLYNYEETYILNIISTDVNYFGTTNINDINDLINHLLTITKNIDVLKEDVIKNYSNKEIIDYKKKQINLFNTNMPTNGPLSEMLADDAIIGDGIYYDGKLIEDVEEKIEDPFD